MGTGRGISLIDMVLIIMILAVLAAVAIPKYIDTRYRAKQEAAMNVLKAVRSAIKDHHDNSAKKGEAGFPVIGARADDLVGNTRTSIFPSGKLPSSPVYGNPETGHGPGSVIAAANNPIGGADFNTDYAYVYNHSTGEIRLTNPAVDPVTGKPWNTF